MDRSEVAARASETLAGMTAKAAPPVTVTVAKAAGMSPSDILVWATLVYTVLMIGHKLWQIYVDVSERRGTRPGRRQSNDR